MEKFDSKTLAEQVVSFSAKHAEGVADIVVKASGFTADALEEIITAAKAGDHRARNKLKAFGTFKDPQLAARVATMNRETRRAFMAARRGKKPSRKGRR